MILTAHGGAMDTHRNSKLYFDTIKDYNIDSIEVDIRKIGNKIFLSHLPTLLPFARPSLSYAFDFCKKYNLKVNCDVKQNNLIAPIIVLAKEYGVENQIYFTGNTVTKKDIDDLNAGELYLNRAFFPFPAIAKNVPKMKQIITSLHNERVKGINFKYTYVTEEFIKACDDNDLAISVFVVDDEKMLKKYLKHTNLANLTTNRPDLALKLLSKEIKK